MIIVDETKLSNGILMEIIKECKWGNISLDEDNIEEKIGDILNLHRVYTGLIPGVEVFQGSN